MFTDKVRLTPDCRMTGSAQNPMSAWSWSITDCRGWARNERCMYLENCALSRSINLCRKDLDCARTSSPCTPLMPSRQPWGQPRDWYILPTYSVLSETGSVLFLCYIM